MSERATYDEACEAFAQIRDHGDVFDAAGLRKPLAVLSNAAIITGSYMYGMGYGATIETAMLPERTVSIVNVVAIGVAAVSAAYQMTSNHFGARRALWAEGEQQTVRDYSGESVDVVRIQAEDDRSMLALRWYGADNTGKESPKQDVARRLTHLADLADLHGIDSLAVGVDAVYPLEDPEAWDDKKYGEVHRGGLFPYKRGWNKYRVRDELSEAENLAVCTLKQARELAELMRAEDVPASALVRLIGRLSDKYPDVGTAYRQMVDDGLDGSHLLYKLRMYVNRELDKQSEPEVVLSRTESGHISRGRSYASSTLGAGEYLNVQRVVAAQEDVEARVESDGSQTLLSAVKAADVESLVELALDESTPPNDMQLFAAAYLTLLGETRQNYGAPQQERSERVDSSTFYMELAGKIASHSYRRGKWAEFAPSDNETVRQGLRPIGKILAAGCMGLVLVGSTNTAKTAVHDEVVGQYLRAYDMRAGSPVNSDRLEQFIDNGASPDVKILEKGFQALDGSYDLTAKWPTTKWLTPSYKDGAGDRNSPPSAGSYLTGDMSLGDAELSRMDKTVLKITPLTGKSSEGYWKTSEQTSLFVAPTEFAAGMGRDIAYDVSAIGPDSLKPEEITTTSQYLDIARQSYEQADFSVDLDVRSSELVNRRAYLPVLDGYRVTGWEITVRDNPEEPVKEKVMMDSEGRYRLIPDIFAPVDRTLHVRYEVTEGRAVGGKTHGQGMSVAINRNNIGIDPDSISFYGSLQHFSSVRQQTLAGLGLPSDATSDQVINAVRSKTYSFTPYTDQHGAGSGTPSFMVKGTEQLNPKGRDAIIMDGVAQMARQTAELKSANCNIASLVTILGTNGVIDGEAAHMASGFHDDGDGIVTQREAHAWLVNDKGQIIDPTPSNAADNAGSEGGAGITLRDVEGGIALAAGVGILLWRRRRLAEQFRSYQVRRALSGRRGARAALLATSGIYGDAGLSVDKATSKGDFDKTRDFVAANLPADVDTKMFLSQLSPAQTQSYAQLSGGDRRALKRLLRSRKFIRQP